MEIGETALSPQEVQQVVHEMGSAYKGNRYHLLQKNCNAFSNDLCIRLTGKTAPAWVWTVPSFQLHSSRLVAVTHGHTRQHTVFLTPAA